MGEQKREYSLRELADATVTLILNKDARDPLVESVQRFTQLEPAQISWEVIALRFFYARMAFMLNFAEWRPAIDTLHVAFFEAIQRANRSTNEEMAELENWLHSRISGYTEAFNSRTGSGERLWKLGSTFADIIEMSPEQKV